LKVFPTTTFTGSSFLAGGSSVLRCFVSFFDFHAVINSVIYSVVNFELSPVNLYLSIAAPAKSTIIIYGISLAATPT